MSQLIREIESRGYIEQVPDPTDTRAKIVRLNKRGVALRQACAVVRQDLQALAQDTLGEKRVAALRRDLMQLTALLNQAQQHKKNSPRDWSLDVARRFYKRHAPGCAIALGASPRIDTARDGQWHNIGCRH